MAVVVVVSTEEASAVAVSTVAAVVVVVSTREASAAALSTGVVVVSVGDVLPVALSTAVAFVVAVLMAATSVAIFAITDSLMMSSSATSAFRGGGVTRTDITVTTITPTITMDTADTHTAMDTAGTVTMVGPVTDTAMAADQGISEVGDKPDYGSLKSPPVSARR